MRVGLSMSLQKSGLMSPRRKLGVNIGPAAARLARLLPAPLLKVISSILFHPWEKIPMELLLICIREF